MKLFKMIVKIGKKIEFLMCWPLHVLVTHMWQSQEEIELYSIPYCVTVFKVLYCRTSIRGGAHMCCVDVSGNCALT